MKAICRKRDYLLSATVERIDMRHGQNYACCKLRCIFCILFITFETFTDFSRLVIATHRLDIHTAFISPLCHTLYWTHAMLFGVFCNQKSCQCQQQKIGKEWRKSTKNFGSFLTVVVQLMESTF